MKVTKLFFFLMAGIAILSLPAILTLSTSLNDVTEQPAIPTPITGTTYFAAFPRTITLDGNFSDWNGIPYADVDRGPQPSPNPQAGSMKFAVVADTQNIYFSILVMDNNIVAGKHGDQYWEEDSVELYINASGNLALTSYTPAVAQIDIPAVNLGTPIDQTIIAGINSADLGVRAVVVKTADGYGIEAALPLNTNVWKIAPAVGTTIGLQLELNDATQLDRDVKLSWSALDQTQDQSYQNPGVFGQLVFTDVGVSALQVLPTLAATPDQTASTATFTVKDSTIYDPQGHIFVAKGVNVNGYNWVWPRKTTPDADLITSCWKFNLVRVNSFLFTGQTPYKQYTTNNNLDEIVNTFTKRGVVVVFEAHDRIGSYYQGDDLAKLVAWFTDLATRYKNNPYVWFDVMNEPGGQFSLDETNWVTVHRAVIHAIRDVAGANNIIMVEGAFGGQDTSGKNAQPASDNDSAILHLSADLFNYGGETYSNIVFSIHTYDQWNYGDAKMADFFDRVHAQNLALIVGEYGVQTNVDTHAAVASLFDTALSRGIGRIVWQWDGSDANDLTVNTSQGGGWEINDCSKPTNLSELGKLVWNDNHS